MASRTILDADPALREAWPRLVAYIRIRYETYYLHIVETHVPPEEQKDRFNAGRNGLGEITHEEMIQTNLDGTEALSLFNYYPSRAVRFDVRTMHGITICSMELIQALASWCDRNNLTFIAPDVITVKGGGGATR